MNILSLFDGMGCGRLALDRAGIEVDHYFASEIDKYAKAVTQHHYPDVIQLGDVRNVSGYNLCDKHIDLVMGGSPCQGFSFAGKQLNFNDPRSALFFEFVCILEEAQPTYFLLENVRMNQRNQDVISKQLGVEPIEIDSALVSAQSRKRLYWTNIPFDPPQDKGILLSDVIENGFVDREKSYALDASYWKGSKNGELYFKKSRRQVVFTEPSMLDPLVLYNRTRRILGNRLLTPLECERLQTVPDNYTLVPIGNRMMSNTQRYKMLGNGWTIDVITHILKGIK
jgi:site-specific DNA-cytosine methylase